MGTLSRISSALAGWIDEVAEAGLGCLERLRAAPFARLVEQEDGRLVGDVVRPRAADSVATEFRPTPEGMAPEDEDRVRAVIAGARVEVLLRPDRFLFRPLELPSRAGEFLDGIVRAQIDRLTPWTATNALFGWSSPAEPGAARMTVTVAATGRNLVLPLITLLSDLGADSISLVVEAPSAPGQRITVLEKRTKAAREIDRARRVLAGGLVGFGGLAVASLLASIIGGSDLESQQADNAARIDAIRAKLQAQGAPSSEPVARARRRKQEAASAVLVLDALSAAVPDHTYLTELRIQDGKVQIMGLTKDAPSLIALLERSPSFSEASFVAPTTKALAKPGDTFQIEAKLRPPGMREP
jgi:general secretion pathway protein L